MSEAKQTKAKVCPHCGLATAYPEVHLATFHKKGVKLP